MMAIRSYKLLEEASEALSRRDIPAAESYLSLAQAVAKGEGTNISSFFAQRGHIKVPFEELKREIYSRALQIGKNELSRKMSEFANSKSVSNADILGVNSLVGRLEKYAAFSDKPHYETENLSKVKGVLHKLILNKLSGDGPLEFELFDARKFPGLEGIPDREASRIVIFEDILDAYKLKAMRDVDKSIAKRVGHFREKVKNIFEDDQEERLKNLDKLDNLVWELTDKHRMNVQQTIHEYVDSLKEGIPQTRKSVATRAKLYTDGGFSNSILAFDNFLSKKITPLMTLYNHNISNKVDKLTNYMLSTVSREMALHTYTKMKFPTEVLPEISGRVSGVFVFDGVYGLDSGIYMVEDGCVTVPEVTFNFSLGSLEETQFLQEVLDAYLNAKREKNGYTYFKNKVSDLLGDCSGRKTIESLVFSEKNDNASLIIKDDGGHTSIRYFRSPARGDNAHVFVVGQYQSRDDARKSLVGEFDINYSEFESKLIETAKHVNS